MGVSVYISDLGYRNPLTDFDQIIWYWNNTVERYNRQSHKSKFWLDLFERHAKRFKELEAFELLNFLKQKVTAEQLRNRHTRRVLNQVKSQLELDHWKDYTEQREIKKDLVGTINLN